MDKITIRLLPVVGKQSFVAFGLVTFLVAALLSATNVTSRYALNSYIEDQLRRTPWDLSVYHPAGATDSAVLNRLRSNPGMRQVEQLLFLRASFSKQVALSVDQKPFATPWLCVLSASDPALLPPELRIALGQGATSNNGGDGGAILALVGPESAMAAAFVSLQGAKNISLGVVGLDRGRELLSIPLRSVIRVKADELNRWFMEQSGSVTMVPTVAAVLLTPFNADVIATFERAAQGRLPARVDATPEDRVNPDGDNASEYLDGEYLPEVTYLAKIDRTQVISGWDIQGSLRRMTAIRDDVRNSVRAIDSGALVDSTVLVLIERMAGISALIGALTILIALPLLCVTWVLAVNLAGLLMLNARRTLGLLRLRGVPGDALGRALLTAITAGGLIGGASGLLVGNVVPLLAYAGGPTARRTLLRGDQIGVSVVFLLLTVLFAWLVGRRIVRYATTISPLEASRRTAGSESKQTAVRFGPLELLAVLLGGYKLASWIVGFSLVTKLARLHASWVDTLLDFIGLPLFVYGISCLLVSKPAFIQGVLTPIINILGGRLRILAVRHVALKPFRTVTFIVTLSLVVSVCLYPAIAGPAFQDRATRGARVGVGADVQITFNAPDLVKGGADDNGAVGSDLRTQVDALSPGVNRLLQALTNLQLNPKAVIYEALLQQLYLPGHGSRGVPLYLIDRDRFLGGVYSEPELGVHGSFSDVVRGTGGGAVAVSQAVAEFWEVGRSSTMPLGKDNRLDDVKAAVSGTLAYLPGMPVRAVTDRQGFVQARVDYLNYLFSNDAYLVGSQVSTDVPHLQALVPRVVILADTRGQRGPFDTARLRNLSVTPLDVQTLPEAIGKLGSDMFVYLALTNMRLYLAAGFLLAIIAISAIAVVNYLEDRRTFGLLRIRGASPRHLARFLVAVILSPSLLGVFVGSVVALLAGFGLANYIWSLRELKTVVQLLHTRLILTVQAAGIVAAVLALVTLTACAFSWSVFRRTARENALEA